MIGAGYPAPSHLCKLSFVFFEPAVKCVGTQAHFFLKPYEEAKAYFLEMMMTAEGEERDRAECVYIQLIHGLSECSDEDK